MIGSEEDNGPLWGVWAIKLYLQLKGGSSMKAIWETIDHTVAALGATYGGVLLSNWANTKWGMIIVPAILAVTKAIDSGYKLAGKPVPAWIAWIH